MFKTNHILKIYHIFNTQKRIEAKKMDKKMEKHCIN